MFTLRLCFSLATVFFLLLSYCRAWIPTSLTPITPRCPPLFAALPNGYQEYGNERIHAAAALCGASPDDISIEWKGGRIVVTVSGNAFLSSPLPSVPADDDEAVEDDDYYDQDDIPEGSVDVATLARAINSALDDDGVGLAIAEAHEIEVTTKGASDELTGIMWESYKGFDVICQYKDPKNDKVKAMEGRLVERNEEFTVINIKGRMKKLKNNNVVSCKLPKAKKEKGAR